MGRQPTACNCLRQDLQKAVLSACSRGCAQVLDASSALQALSLLGRAFVDVLLSVVADSYLSLAGVMLLTAILMGFASGGACAGQGRGDRTQDSAYIRGSAEDSLWATARMWHVHHNDDITSITHDLNGSGITTTDIMMG